ncbi:MAG: PLP-dependent transferase [Chlorobi bacterium]|nr:PLP-dependent transferase [Chlorobiota bacterium]
MSQKEKSLDTLCVHAGWDSDPCTGAVNPPVYFTSTYRQEAPGNHKGFEYSRTGNPTRKALEEAVAALEGGQFGYAFASGMAAIDAVLRVLDKPLRVVSIADLYGGTFRLFEKVYRPLGYEFWYAENNDELISLIDEHKPDMVWIESPTNPLLTVVDIEAVVEAARKTSSETLVVVDNTFATPYLQRPIPVGADIVVHSATKYLAGHSDVVLGAVVTNREDLGEKIGFIQNAAGGVPGPMDSFLTLRGIRTLHLRMERHCQNAKAIADFLSHHPAVERVYFPGLPSHEGHTIAAKQMKDFGGMVTFRLKKDTLDAAQTFFSRLEIFQLTESLGGVESLANHPAIMTHASFPKEERIKRGITDGLIRLSVGIEDTQDLIADISQALEPLA